MVDYNIYENEIKLNVDKGIYNVFCYDTNFSCGVKVINGIQDLDHCLRIYAKCDDSTMQEVVKKLFEALFEKYSSDAGLILFSLEVEKMPDNAFWHEFKKYANTYIPSFLNYNTDNDINLMGITIDELLEKLKKNNDR